MILGQHVITVRRATTTEDEYGNPAPTGELVTTVEGCSVQALSGTEVTVGRDTIVSRWQVFAPPSADVTATDRVEWAGDTYEVDGEVQRMDFPPLSHLYFFLRRSHS